MSDFYYFKTITRTLGVTFTLAKAVLKYYKISLIGNFNTKTELICSELCIMYMGRLCSKNLTLNFCKLFYYKKRCGPSTV